MFSFFVDIEKQMSQKRKRSSSENEETEEISSESPKKPAPGVIYLSRIPNKMNVTIIRSYFEEYAPVGRIYLQLSSKSITIRTDLLIFGIFFVENEGQQKRQRGPKYTEGWVEFQSKRDAKLIAKQLNNQQVGGRRRTPWYDEIWNIK